MAKSLTLCLYTIFLCGTVMIEAVNRFSIFQSGARSIEQPIQPVSNQSDITTCDEEGIKHIRVRDRESEFTIFLLNTVSSLGQKSCLELDGDTQSCNNHPRCSFVEYASPPNISGSETVHLSGLCLLDPHYLNLISTADNCSASPGLSEEYSFVAEDLVREERVEMRGELTVERFCDFIEKQGHSLLGQERAADAADVALNHYRQMACQGSELRGQNTTDSYQYEMVDVRIAPDSDSYSEGGISFLEVPSDELIVIEDVSNTEERNWRAEIVTYGADASLASFEELNAFELSNEDADSIQNELPWMERHLENLQTEGKNNSNWSALLSSSAGRISSAHRTPGFQLSSPKRIARTSQPTSLRPSGLFAMSNPDTSSPVKVGINGFGRIGRLVLRAALLRNDLQVTHINCSMSPEYIKYLLEHDTTHRALKADVHVKSSSMLNINGKDITLSNFRDPGQIPWADSGVEYVCESTGAFLTSEKAQAHVNRPGGAKKVVLSAPAKDETTPTLVVGVNAAQDYNPASNVVSNASCTTNALAPLVKVLDDKFGFVEGLMTTVHAVTASQQVVDTQNKKAWRLGRSMTNMIPSTTGAAKAVSKCIPRMKGKLTGMSIRVPTIDVSMVDLTCRFANKVSFEELKAEIKNRSLTDMKGIIGYTEEPIVSNDVIGETCSTLFDASASIALNDQFVKIISWYDNEAGYANRLVDLIRLMATKDAVTQRTQTTSVSVGHH